MTSPSPRVGEWYRRANASLFEVVAIDDEDSSVQVQHFDGTVEEMDIEDWQAEQENGALEEVQAPEDWTGSVDVDPEEDDVRGALGYGNDDDRRQSTSKLEGLDLFE